jgi:hypothetical protein
MGKKSFALGVLTALAAAAATEDSRTYAHTTYTTPVTTHTYEQATPTRVVYTTGTTPALTTQARAPFDKMMRVNRAFTISGSDCLYEVGKELRRVYLEDESNRTSLTFNERKLVRKVIDVYDLPIGDAKMLAFRFGRLVHSSLV